MTTKLQQKKILIHKFPFQKILFLEDYSLEKEAKLNSIIDGLNIRIRELKQFGNFIDFVFIV